MSLPIVPQPMQCVFYGCWNDITYRSKADRIRPPRDHVLDKVKDVLKDEKFDMFILAGDNIYAHKEKVQISEKEIKKTTTFLEQSLNVLEKDYWKKAVPTMEKKIFLFALGNHNVEDKAVYSRIEPKIKSLLPAPALLHERKIPNFYWYENKGSRFIIIDTNVFDDSEASVDQECEWIKKVIGDAKQGTNIIVIGHHPLAFVDYKKENAGKYKLGMAHAKELYACFPDNNTVSTYLCADTHNYQQTELVSGKRRVQQIISGTGGAKPDITSSELIKKTIGAKMHIPEIGCYMMINDLANPFGYCLLNITSKGVVPKYVKIQISKGPNKYANTEDDIKENKTYQMEFGGMGSILKRKEKISKMNKNE